MNILLVSGHGAGDPGAQGCGYKEADLTRELTKLIMADLKGYQNAKVYRYPESRNAYKDIQSGQFNNVLKQQFAGVKFDYAFEVHFNAFNGKAYGTEVFVTYAEKEISVEQEVMKNMKKYFTLRDNDAIKDGVKRTNFLVIQTLKNKGVSSALLETCFIDNKNDMSTYNANKKKIAAGIAAGIASGFGLKKAAVAPVKKEVKAGSKVKVAPNAVIGGLAANRGKSVKDYPYLKSNTWKVVRFDTHHGVYEALLSCNTWIAVKYLTAI